MMYLTGMRTKTVDRIVEVAGNIPLGILVQPLTEWYLQPPISKAYK